MWCFLMAVTSSDTASHGPKQPGCTSEHGPIPVIMFTGHAKDLAEGQLKETERSQRAAFVGFMGKPFDLDALVVEVRQAAGDQLTGVEVTL